MPRALPGGWAALRAAEPELHDCDRLPMSKEDTIIAYRQSLEAHGVRTADWWDRQLDLALLGGFLQLGWSKTGDPVELGWWVERVLPVARELDR